MDLQISLAAQRFYATAKQKYGKVFADAVVAQELQLHADNLACFEEYAQSEVFQEFIVSEP